jgi:hypothetical protein
MIKMNALKMNSTLQCAVACCDTYTLVNSQTCPKKAEDTKDTAMTDSFDNTRYLTTRLEGIYCSMPLRAMFNLNLNNSPKTYKELIAAIKNDKFSLDEKRTKIIDAQVEDSDEDMDYFYGSAFDGIIWDGPKPDKKGYEIARAELKVAYQDALDVIKGSADAEKRLAALEAFKNWKPSNAPAN